jgi:hypothetical protein
MNSATDFGYSIQGQLPTSEPHFCRCCGEETATSKDCCSDDFLEAADLRETGP